MKTIVITAALFGMSALAAECQQAPEKGSFAYDIQFLKKHKKTVVLKSDDDRCQVALVPDYQGRVMTSTSGGDGGKSYGWLNYDLISSGGFVKHINVFGGEDRFWMGPEGGQFAIFFEKGEEFTFENWQTPAAIDTEPFEMVRHDDSSASFHKKMTMTNYSGYTFDLEVTRDISILSKAKVESNLKIALADGVDYVGFQSSNQLKNTGDSAWKKETGLLSVWILGMFNPSDDTSVIIPYKNAIQLNSNYFGQVPADRLVTTNRAVFFKADGRQRGKIGLPPLNIIPRCGSYDAKNRILTIVEYTFSDEKDYVNSFWEMQDKPYAGDVVNSYNDGPLEDGSQLGPFYELETSSSARPLGPRESIEHVHKTYHFEGGFDELNHISKEVLGVDLNQISFSKKKDTAQTEVLVPHQENEWTWLYKPAGDTFYGPDTEVLKEGEHYDDWVPNDHTFVRADDGRWHILGITHPYVAPCHGDIHQGEYASFHAVSSATTFQVAMEEHHFSDLPKILPPAERPGEPLANHAPYILKKGGLYHMIYGPSPLRLAVSKDLSKWELKGEIFSQDGGSRDPNLLLHDGIYYLSYCSHRSVLMRTSRDLVSWSEPTSIFAADNFDPESPSLIHHNGTFYLFVCSWNGVWDQKEIQGAYQHKTYVYQSHDLLDFGVGDTKEIATLNAHAPEVFQDEDGQWFISSVEWPNRGVSVDKLSWKQEPASGFD